MARICPNLIICFMISVTEKDLPVKNIESTLCLISGTSACHMILSKKKMMIPGIWGPYFSAILGDYWLHEGLV